MADRPVVVVGDANVDMVIRLPDRSKGKQADMSDSVPRLYGGGSAANTAVALARLGARTAFIGGLGDEGYGRFVVDDLRQEGIDLSGLRIIPNSFTPMVIAMIEPSGERLIVVWPPERGADTQLAPEDLPEDQIRGAAWLHTTGMCLRASPVRESVLRAMEIAAEAGVPVSLDLNLRLELWGWRDNIRETIERAIALSSVVLGSADEEIVPVARVASVEAAAQMLSGGRRLVIARRGQQGVLAAAPDGIYQASAYPARVVDLLGAGDAFNGGFIAARVVGRPIEEALCWGNATAALKIAQPGARGLPTRADVDRLIAGS